jgi:hypothetical protein
LPPAYDTRELSIYVDFLWGPILGSIEHVAKKRRNNGEILKDGARLKNLVKKHRNKDGTLYVERCNGGIFSKET